MAPCKSFELLSWIQESFGEFASRTSTPSIMSVSARLEETSNLLSKEIFPWHFEWRIIPWVLSRKLLYSSEWEHFCLSLSSLLRIGGRNSIGPSDRMVTVPGSNLIWLFPSSFKDFSLIYLTNPWIILILLGSLPLLYLLTVCSTITAFIQFNILKKAKFY